MTSLSARRARILRVRQLESRVATARLLAANNAFDDLNRISSRIATLRGTLRSGEIACTGQELKAMHEMATRLEAAQNDLAMPLAEAQRNRLEIAGLDLAAHAREDGAARLHQRAVADETYANSIRADANRPYRKNRRSRTRSAADA